MIHVLVVQERSTRNVMEHKPIIIGITGHPASGKDTVADYLVSRGFTKISMGDILREEMTVLQIPIDRSHMNDFAKKVRAERGNGYLSEEIVRRVKGDTTIAGVRNSSELKIFREGLGENFKLLAIETPLETRYERAKMRGRIGDSISFEQFKLEDERERAAQSGSHEVATVIASADVCLENDGTMEDLFKKVDDFVASLK